MRFRHAGKTGFGALEGDEVVVHDGDMFGAPMPTGERLRADAIEWLTPSQPSKFICIWNNFHALGGQAGADGAGGAAVPDQGAPMPTSRTGSRSARRPPTAGASSTRANSAS